MVTYRNAPDPDWHNGDQIDSDYESDEFTDYDEEDIDGCD
jgi:hypothetical protein